MTENYITATELSKALSMSKSGVIQLARNGQLPAGYRIGRSRRWLFSEVREWLSAKQRDMKGA